MSKVKYLWLLTIHSHPTTALATLENFRNSLNSHRKISLSDLLIPAM